MINYRFIKDNHANLEFQAENDTEALKTADAHFKDNDGEWEISNEGEDANGVVTHINWTWLSHLFVAVFESSLYPEDNRILGVFSNRIKAEAAIEAAMETDKSGYPNHPKRWQQHRCYYNIRSMALDTVVY